MQPVPSCRGGHDRSAPSILGRSVRWRRNSQGNSRWRAAVLADTGRDRDGEDTGRDGTGRSTTMSTPATPRAQTPTTHTDRTGRRGDGGATAGRSVPAVGTTHAATRRRMLL